MYDLKNAVAVVEDLALEDQFLLRLLLSEAVYKKQTVHKKRPREKYDGLIGAGLVVEVDENGVPYTIPKGAQFVAFVSLGGSSLSLIFPDDEITELLDYYGVNRCKGWTR